jgi:membrane associated rhomboid family serine protease
MKNSKLWAAIRPAVYLIVLIWGVHILQFLTPFDFGQFGIYPRDMTGLRGILFSPLVHGDFGHLINNSVPLFVLSSMIFYFYPRVGWRSFLMIYLLTGLFVWIFGRSVFHIGASGVVYGLVSFVFWTGIFRRNLKAIVLGLIVAFLYSGMFLGVLPNQEGISWESHLIGGLVGIFVAYWYKEETESDEAPTRYSWEDEPEDSNRPHFLQSDTFEKTKEDRRKEDDQKKWNDWTSSNS